MTNDTKEAIIERLIEGGLEEKFGRIIQISSVVGFTGNPGQANYVASKAGLIGMTKSLALEFGPEIRVNGVSPGSVMWPENKEYESKQQEIIDSTALKRQGDKQDIASTCAFLINDANYITGQIINVDGGRSLSR